MRQPGRGDRADPYVLGAILLFFWVGPLFDRHGARKVVVVGTVAMTCGVMLLALVSRPWHVYAAFAVMSVGWATLSGAAINIIVALRPDSVVQQDLPTP